MGDLPDTHDGGSTEAFNERSKESHAEVTTLTGELRFYVLAGINWRRYGDVENGSSSVVVDFEVVETSTGPKEHAEVFMSMGTPRGDVYPTDITDVLFQRIGNHIIDYYKFDFDGDYWHDDKPGLVVKESSPLRSTAERIVPEAKEQILEFEPIPVPVEMVQLTGLEQTMHHIEYNTELSTRETQAFVLESVGLDNDLIAQMMDVEPSTVKEYKNRISDKVGRYQLTLSWLDDYQVADQEYV